MTQCTSVNVLRPVLRAFFIALLGLNLTGLDNIES